MDFEQNIDHQFEVARRAVKHHIDVLCAMALLGHDISKVRVCGDPDWDYRISRPGPTHYVVNK